MADDNKLSISLGALCCPGCRDSAAPLERADDQLRCATCEATYPVVRGIPVMLAAGDQQLSLDSAAACAAYQPPEVGSPELSDAPLQAGHWLRLGARASKEVARYGRGIIPAAGAFRRKDQRVVKEKYEDHHRNYYVSGAKRHTLLLDARPRRMTAFRYRQELMRALVSACESVGAKSVLEAGCGDGINFWILDNWFAGHDLELRGFDFSFFRTELARHYVGGKHELFNGDAKRIALPDASVDVAYTVHCLEHMAHDNLEALAELARVAKHVVLIEPFVEFQNLIGRVHSHGSDYARDLRQNAERSGLSVIEFRKLGLGSVFNQSGLLVARSTAHQGRSGASRTGASHAVRS